MKIVHIPIGLLIALAICFVAFSIVGAKGNECADDWTFSYSFEFDPGYWSIGYHNYDILVISGPYAGYTWSNNFEVREQAKLIDGQVHLRAGVLTSIDGAHTIINPAQDTVMQFTYAFFESRKEAEDSRSATTMVFRWDGGDWVNILPSPVTSWCAWDNPGLYFRSWGTKIGPKIDIEIGSISGTVIDEDGGEPLTNILVMACDFDWYPCGHTRTDAEGNYLFTLLPGTYMVIAWPDIWVREFYDDTLYAEFATPISIDPGEEKTGIDFTLELGGSISGTVTNEVTGEPLEGIEVSICEYNNWDNCFWGEWTDSNGNYTIRGLPAGITYWVWVWEDNWVREFYDDEFNGDLATPVSLDPGEELTGIDFTLELGGSISGTVTYEVTGEPLEGIEASVCEYNNWDNCFWGEWTDSNGNYTIRGLPAGITYWVLVWQDNWVREFYDDEFNGDLATPVSLDPGEELTGIDFTLELGGSISGTVTNEVTGEPLEGIEVSVCEIYDWGNCFGDARTDSNGDYTIQGLPAGITYWVWVLEDGWLVEFFDNTQDPDLATPISLDPGEELTGIDFTLEATY